MDSEDKGRIGVCKTGFAVIKLLGFKFREQPTSDYGIDAHIEVKHDEEYPTGKLIAVQIKTDKSDCSESKNHYNFRFNRKHLNYWLNHSLPVIIVHYDSKNDILNWVHLSEDKITKNKQSWSIKIPKNKVLDKSSKRELENIAENINIQARKYNILQESLVLMEHLAHKNKVCIEFEDWINKSFSIRNLNIVIYSKDNKELEKVEWPFDVFPNNLEEGLSKMFPWANIENDINEDELYDYLRTKYKEMTFICNIKGLDVPDFTKWCQEEINSMPKISPYKNAYNEVDFYKLNLTLNSLGESFLELNKYFNSFDEFIRY